MGFHGKLYDVKFRGFSSKVPSTKEKVYSYLQQGPGLRPLLRVSTPNENPVQSSIWLADSCSRLHFIACGACIALSPVPMERKQACAQASAGHAARDQEEIRSTREREL